METRKTEGVRQQDRSERAEFDEEGAFGRNGLTGHPSDVMVWTRVGQEHLLR